MLFHITNLHNPRVNNIHSGISAACDLAFDFTVSYN